MPSDVQLPEPAADLLAAAELTVRPWLRALVQRHVDPSTAGTASDSDELVERCATRLLTDLRALLAVDVDAQKTNPLAVFRGATEPVTAWLLQHGVEPRQRDPFAEEAFPDDVFGLHPARWDDIDPSLQSPGITWGAWKAMTVLQRRRAEGSR